MSDAELTALAGESPQRTARGYTGHEHLERTGLIHMNGRVYDPVIGRFLSPDPIVADASFSQSWNAYSYALNSPLSYSDPTGLSISTVSVYGDRSWDYASLSMLESLLWNSFYHSHQLPLYFNEFFDARIWNEGVFPGSAPVPLQGAVSVGEEMGPADRPMGLGRSVLDFFFPVANAQELENPQARAIDRLFEAAVNGEPGFPLEELIGGLRALSDDAREALQQRGDVILSDIILSEELDSATGIFENAANGESTVRLRPGVMILAPTMRGRFKVSEESIELTELEGIRGGAFRFSADPIDTITIPRQGNFDYTER